jgi:hypothetical protein
MLPFTVEELTQAHVLLGDPEDEARTCWSGAKAATTEQVVYREGAKTPRDKARRQPLFINEGPGKGEVPLVVVLIRPQDCSQELIWSTVMLRARGAKPTMLS